jgi:tricorn protease
MNKITPLVLFLIIGATSLMAQIDARMLRQPDVSDTHITFVYGGDIWVVSKDGGLATKLSSPEGSESFPRFSPDGKHIAFTGNYNGNGDIYIIPSMGGLPKRITHHGGTDRILDWYPDGDNLLYASFMESGRQRFRQMYKVSVDGGLAEKLPIPYGEFGSISEDGKWLAYTKRTRTHRTWKRYRGGTAPDIWLFNLETMESMKITDNDANNELPMWHGNKVYYLSDNTPQNRFNIFVYDVDTKKRKQLTKFEEYDIHYPAIGPNDIVFEAGGILHLMDLKTEQIKEVQVDVVTDKMTLQPRNEKVDNLVFNANPSPDGKRVVVEARGDLFSVPAEHGPIMNLTNSSESNERYPDWSPNGKHIAYWSDASGEYELYVMDTKERSTEKSQQPMVKVTATEFTGPPTVKSSHLSIIP